MLSYNRVSCKPLYISIPGPLESNWSEENTDVWSSTETTADVLSDCICNVQSLIILSQNLVLEEHFIILHVHNPLFNFNIAKISSHTVNDGSLQSPSHYSPLTS